MSSIKTDEEIETLREGGKRLARILRLTGEKAVSGVHTDELNTYAEKLIREGGDTPAFLNYTPTGATRPYPATLCVSVNDEIVHGIPNEDPMELKAGDIVGLDLGLVHDGLIVDAAVTVAVGNIDAKSERLMRATKEALVAGINAARAGKHVGDIGAAVQGVTEKYEYGTVYELGGHGVGHKVHEEPHIPNFGKKGTGTLLEKNMVLALEPMLTEGSGDVVLAPDEYTYKTADGKRSAHFEHTIVVLDGEAEILTKE